MDELLGLNMLFRFRQAKAGARAGRFRFEAKWSASS